MLAIEFPIAAMRLLISSMCQPVWTQMVNGAAVDQATVYAGIYNNLFKSIYFYEFNRSYAPTTDKSYCNSPITPGIFEDTELGNPDNEYFECHGAQMYSIFGTVRWNGLPLRDENDLPFEQFIVDSWTSFARI
jgi:hypothetical protein